MAMEKSDTGLNLLCQFIFISVSLSNVMFYVYDLFVSRCTSS